MLNENVFVLVFDEDVQLSRLNILKLSDVAEAAVNKGISVYRLQLSTHFRVLYLAQMFKRMCLPLMVSGFAL